MNFQKENVAPSLALISIFCLIIEESNPIWKLGEMGADAEVNVVPPKHAYKLMEEKLHSSL
jgi:hypothetical protein